MDVKLGLSHCSECGNACLDSLKCGEFLDYLKTC